MSGNTKESYSLFFRDHRPLAVAMTIGKNDPYEDWIWLPKSQIEVDGCEENEDYNYLVVGERLDVLIPDFVAEDKGLL